MLTFSHMKVKVLFLIQPATGFDRTAVTMETIAFQNGIFVCSIQQSGTLLNRGRAGRRARAAY